MAKSSYQTPQLDPVEYIGNGPNLYVLLLFYSAISEIIKYLYFFYIKHAEI